MGSPSLAPPTLAAQQQRSSPLMKSRYVAYDPVQDRAAAPMSSSSSSPGSSTFAAQGGIGASQPKYNVFNPVSPTVQGQQQQQEDQAGMPAAAPAPTQQQ